MAYKITAEYVCGGAIKDRTKALAEKLQALSDGGLDLEIAQVEVPFSLSGGVDGLSEGKFEVLHGESERSLHANDVGEDGIDSAQEFPSRLLVDLESLDELIVPREAVDGGGPG